MAVAIPAIASAAVAAASGTTILGLSVLASAALIGAASLATSLLSQALTPKPKLNTGIDNDQSLMLRQSIAPRRIVMGRVRTSGVMTFAESTADNKTLHVLITLTTHPVAGMDELWLDDEVVPLDANGNATGKYAGFVKAYFGDGTPEGDQQLHAALRAYCPKWTDKHLQQGCAKLYVMMTANRTKFPNGFPNPSAVILAWDEINDPRSLSEAWTDNAALCLARYLTAPVDIGGAGWAADSIDMTVLAAAANACDEMVPLQESSISFTVNAGTDTLTLADKSLGLRTGTKVHVSSAGTLPAGLSAATDYYWIMTGAVTGKLATSLTNARAGTVVDITGAGTGTHSVTRKAEPRYTVNGVIETDQKPSDIILRLTGAMAGSVAFVSGKWHILPGVWRAPTVTLDEDDLSAGFAVNAARPKRELVNGVKGTFVDPDGFYQATDFPAVTGDTYLAEDNNIRAWRDTVLPYTASPSMAQRIAMIELQRNRRQITTELVCKLTAFRVKAGDVIGIDNEDMGWSGKTFEVVEWKFDVREVDGVPFFGTRLTLVELDENAFAWTTADERILPPAARTNLPDPSVVPQPGAPSVTEELYISQSGAGIKSSAIVTWGAVDDGFVREYQLEYRLQGAAEWLYWERTPALDARIDDLNPGIYEFRLLAINGLGAQSEYSEVTVKELAGITAPPADITGLNLVARNGQAHLSWNRPTDLDVLNGGRIRVLYTPDTVTPAWNTAQDIVPSVDSGIAGSATECTLPLLNGTYLVKAVDSAGNVSVNAAAVTVTNAEMVAMNVVVTSTQQPGFAGSKSGVLVSGGTLVLDRDAMIDDEADFDAIGDLDSLGDLVADATYTFAAPIDLGAIFTSRVTSVLRYLLLDTTDSFDERPGTVDEWDDFDGEVRANAGRVWLEVRTTPDNPAGSPVWSEWTKFVIGDYVARAFQFRLRIQLVDPQYQVQVTELEVVVDMPDRVLSGTAASGTGADTTVTYAQAFYGTPTPVVTINNQQPGDVLELVSASATGFAFNIRNAGSRVARNCNWTAKSY